MSWLSAILPWLARQEPIDNRARAVDRAQRIAAMPSRYVLGAGGRDPRALTPFTMRDGVLGSDCVGFTSWCLGHDRYQPKTFPRYDGWINTDSLMADANDARTWYGPVSRPEPGDVVVFPSIYRDGQRRRMGHIGLVVDVPDDFPEDFHFAHHDRSLWLTRVAVIDCAGARSRREKGYAVAQTTAAASWDKPDAMFARCVRAP